MDTGVRHIKDRYPREFEEAVSRHVDKTMLPTPRTDAVQRASRELPAGSIVEIPEGHPPCDPWELARQLEQETNVVTILDAIRFAKDAHKKQTRKYTNEPYLTHPMAVAGLVASVTDDPDMIIAAILHDTVEDCEKVTIDHITENFGPRVSHLVSDLTDVSKKSDGNRKKRKEIDRQHTAEALPESKTIKLGDLIDNLKNIDYFDEDFADVYMNEKMQLLHVLQEGDETLFRVAYDIVYDYFEKKAEV